MAIREKYKKLEDEVNKKCLDEYKGFYDKLEKLEREKWQLNIEYESLYNSGRQSKNINILYICPCPHPADKKENTTDEKKEETKETTNSQCKGLIKANDGSCVVCERKICLKCRAIVTDPNFVNEPPKVEDDQIENLTSKEETPKKHKETSKKKNKKHLKETLQTSLLA